LDRQFWLSQDDNSENQVGDLSDFEGGEIRVLRAGVVGTLNFKRPWRYTIFAGSNTFDKGFDVDTSDEFAVFDYRLDIPLPADLMLSVGKQKEPQKRCQALTYDVVDDGALREEVRSRLPEALIMLGAISPRWKPCRISQPHNTGRANRSAIPTGPGRRQARWPENRPIRQRTRPCGSPPTGTLGDQVVGSRSMAAFNR